MYHGMYSNSAYFRILEHGVPVNRDGMTKCTVDTMRRCGLAALVGIELIDVVHVISILLDLVCTYGRMLCLLKKRYV